MQTEQCISYGVEMISDYVNKELSISLGRVLPWSASTLPYLPTSRSWDPHLGNPAVRRPSSGAVAVLALRSPAYTGPASLLAYHTRLSNSDFWHRAAFPLAIRQQAQAAGSAREQRRRGARGARPGLARVSLRLEAAARGPHSSEAPGARRPTSPRLRPRPSPSKVTLD